MKVILYNNVSAANVVSKTLNPVGEVEGYIKDATSILAPVITLERDSPTGFNYFQIPEFNRYYFLNGVSSVTRNLISISGTVDVLQTYATQIRACSAIVKRQENKYNLYLDDGIFKAYQNPRHKIIKFTKGFNSFSFILALAGNSE